MDNLKLITTENFGNIKCDFYSNLTNDVFLTREQVGQALEYSNPQKAIDNIHSRHKDRLDKFSVTSKIKCNDNKFYNTLLYAFEGILIICSLSQQEKAYDFSQWLINLFNKTQDVKIINTRKETEFIKLLTDLFDEYQIKYAKQYQYKNYKIDLYLPELFIAIEYDEVKQHKYYSYSQQEFRERYLKDNLKCNFLRLKDTDSNGKNIAKTLKFIQSIQ